MRGLKHMKKFVHFGILRRHGILEFTRATNPEKIRRKAQKRDKKFAKRCRARGRGQSSSGTCSSLTHRFSNCHLWTPGYPSQAARGSSNPWVSMTG